MPPTPEEMAQTMIRNLKEKTGRTLEEWLPLARSSRIDKHGAMVKWLKAEQGLTHGYANLIAHKALASDAGSADDDLIAAQYAGPKAGLKPIHDALMAGVQPFGRDLEVAPKKSYVSLRRKKQFALIQPSTRTRVDVGLNLKGVEPTGRLEASGSFNAMVSHRVRLESPEQVDAELIGWLRQAFDAAG